MSFCVDQVCWNSNTLRCNALNVVRLMPSIVGLGSENWGCENEGLRGSFLSLRRNSAFYARLDLLFNDTCVLIPWFPWPSSKNRWPQKTWLPFSVCKTKSSPRPFVFVFVATSRFIWFLRPPCSRNCGVYRFFIICSSSLNQRMMNKWSRPFVASCRLHRRSFFIIF